jgi:hypothetical protein
MTIPGYAHPVVCILVAALLPFVLAASALLWLLDRVTGRDGSKDGFPF